MKDPIVLPRLAVGCAPIAEPLTALLTLGPACVENLASFGPDARRYGPLFVKFLNSENAREQVVAIDAIAVTGYEPGFALLVQKLDSPDWRVVNEAVVALGRIGFTAALPKIKTVAREHWLPELKALAEQVSIALASPTGRYEPEVGRGFFVDGAPHAPRLDEAVACPSRRWTWNGATFSAPADTEGGLISLKIGNGVLRGTNFGEFGGALHWEEGGVITQIVHEMNVVAIEPVGSTQAVVLFGLWHLAFAQGYAALATRDDTGTWKLTEVARLPINADGLRKLGPDLFAASSWGRTVVFSTKGIQGLASCKR